MDLAVELARNDKHAKPSVNIILVEAADESGHAKLTKLCTSIFAQYILTYANLLSQCRPTCNVALVCGGIDLAAIDDRCATI